MMIGKEQGTLLVFCMPMFGLGITSKDVTHNGKIVQVIKVKAIYTRKCNDANYLQNKI